MHFVPYTTFHISNPISLAILPSRISKMWTRRISTFDPMGSGTEWGPMSLKRTMLSSTTQSCVANRCKLRNWTSFTLAMVHGRDGDDRAHW
jgi:hypothetical protein